MIHNLQFQRKTLIRICDAMLPKAFRQRKSIRSALIIGSTESRWFNGMNLNFQQIWPLACVKILSNSESLARASVRVCMSTNSTKPESTHVHSRLIVKVANF
jgi:hypothetical protein